jgi:hypothetical protein
VAEALHAHALPGSLERRLGEERERERAVPRVVARLGEDERGRRHAALGEDLLGPPLVEGEGERERIRGVVRNAEELADRGDVAFTVRAVKPLGDVEDEIRPGGEELRGERLVRLEADHLAERRERALDGVDGAGLIPLGVEIGLREIGAEGAEGLVEIGGGLEARSGIRGRSCWFEIEGESYPNSQVDLLLQKRPSARDEPNEVAARPQRCRKLK